jgi:hypothetical protein
MAARRTHLLIVLPLVLAACGGSSSHSVQGDPLTVAADTTAKQAGEKVAMQAKIDLSGQTLTLDGDGAFAKDRGVLHLKFDLGGFGSSTADEVFEGNIAWLRVPLLASQLGGKHWVRLDLTKHAQAFGFDLNALAGQTPSSALATLRRGGSVSTLGKETVGGVETTHYRKTPGGEYKSVDAWVDDQDLVRRVKLDYDAQLDPSSKQRAHTVLTMDFSDFGSAVSATPPPASDAVDVSEVGR